MDPDYYSAVTAALLATASQMLVFGLLWRLQRGTPGVGLWFGSTVMIVVALLVLMTRSGVWFDHTAVSIGFSLSRIWLPNLLLSAAPLVFLAGVRRFLGKPALAALPLLVLAANFGVLTWHTLVTPDLAQRTFLQEATRAVFFLITAATLVAHRDPDLRLSTRVAGGIFALVSCSFALRAALVFPEIGAAFPNEQILLSKNALLGTTVNCMLWTFGAVFLVQQRQAAVIARLHRDALALEGEKRVLEHQQRLSRDLHDGFGGAAASINLLAAAAGDASPEDSRRLLEKIAVLAGEANSEIRSMMNKLDNPELSRGKWLAEFRFYASTLLDGAGLRLEWQATGFDSALIGDALASLSLLRALKEVLHNVVRHAQAHTVTIVCHASADSLAITFRDDGIGIPPGPTTGRGLPGLHRRAADLGGSLRITPAAPGTCLEFIIPLPLSFTPTGEG
jgi:signal transduction histidine kinase